MPVVTTAENVLMGQIYRAGKRPTGQIRTDGYGSHVSEHAVQRSWHTAEIDCLDEQRCVAGLSVPHEPPQLLLVGQRSLGGLLLEGAKRCELAFGSDDLFHGRGTGRADELVLEVFHAHEEPEPFHVCSGEDWAQAGSLETSPEVTLLGGIAQAGQFDVRPTGAEPIQEPADGLRSAHRHDGDALGGEIPATALGQRFER